LEENLASRGGRQPWQLCYGPRRSAFLNAVLLGWCRLFERLNPEQCKIKVNTTKSLCSLF
jgi:hypothetical protein